ncbi:MAG: TIGR00341 family protein, partial [Phycisphaerales bacterium]|nr:TIGR00341 family protein [Phycisphaerales bacterium]
MPTLVVVLDEDVLASTSAAIRIASAIGPGVALLCTRRDDAPGLELVAPNSTDRSGLVQATVAQLESVGSAVPPVYDCRGPKVDRAVLSALSELEAHRIVVPANLGDRSTSQALVRRLIRVAPVDVVLLDSGSSPDPPRRVLVPQLEGGGAHALRLASRFVGSTDATIEAMADPTAVGRSRRVFGGVRDRLPGDRQQQFTQSEPAGPFDAALANAVANGDLVLVDADDLRHVPRVLAVLGELRRSKPDTAFAVGLTRAEDAVGPGRIQRAIERLRLHAPTLTREERREVHQLLERGGSLSANFMVMLVLSASIAALGLIQSSTAVVIGAMLVAPLMTPLLAIGMSLVQGNVQLFRKATRAVALGVCGALLASMFIAMLSPWSDLSAEVVARGSPNPFDLCIALLSGIAAAYALARPGLAGTLVGVAIAVALVPPLAAVGIATVKLHFAIASGAAVLFLTNLLAIIFGAAVVFRFFGLDASLRGRRTPRWV